MPKYSDIISDGGMDPRNQPPAEAQAQDGGEAVAEFIKSALGNYPVLKWRDGYIARIGDKFYTNPPPTPTGCHFPHRQPPTTSPAPEAPTMTSNVELLPLPELPVAVERFILSSLGPMKREGAVTALRTMLRDYALANVLHHTALLRYALDNAARDIKALRGVRDAHAAEIAALRSERQTQPPTEATPDQTFAEWLAAEMPPGTMIGDPAWRADRIARQYAKRCAPPSAPAGVEAVFNLVRACESAVRRLGWRSDDYNLGHEARMLAQDYENGAFQAARETLNALAQQPAAVAPVGVEGLMQLARNWCLAWGEWAHDADPGCAKENAAEAALRAALIAALAQQPAACPKCGGTGEADSGGVMPWGAPAMTLCECQQPAAVDRRHPYVQSKDHGGCANCGYPEWETRALYTAPPADALGAVRELPEYWRGRSATGESVPADELEAALAQAPAVRVDDVLLRVSDEDLRWCKDIVGALQEAGGPTNNMRAVGLSRLIAALEAALGQGKANGS